MRGGPCGHRVERRDERGDESVRPVMVAGPRPLSPREAMDDRVRNRGREAVFRREAARSSRHAPCATGRPSSVNRIRALIGRLSGVGCSPVHIPQHDPEDLEPRMRSLTPRCLSLAAWIALAFIGAPIASAQITAESPASTEKAPVLTRPGSAGLARGVNFGNMLEGPFEGAWGLTVEEVFFDKVVEAEMDHIRLPVKLDVSHGHRAALHDRSGVHGPRRVVPRSGRGAGAQGHPQRAPLRRTERGPGG